MVTSDQFGGIVRAVVTFASGYAVQKGWTDSNTAVWIGGGVVLLATGVWSWWTNRPAKVIPSAALK